MSVTAPCIQCGREFGIPASWAARTTKRSCPTCPKLERPVTPRRPTSITPKASDRVDTGWWDNGGAVVCSRCERTRQRGVRCECERWTPEGELIAS